MRKFSTYIEYLLMTRHYCYVPGKGAYMLSDEPATMGKIASIGKDSRRVHTLEAPHRVVRFSPLHTYDDGMLANLLMEAEGMTYDEACRYIERQASLLPDDFHTSTACHIDTENFGYNAISVETWSDIEARLNADKQQEEQSTASVKKESLDADVIAIPRYWAQRVAVVLLIAVCFFANFLGFDDQSTQQQYANVIDLSMLQRGSTIHQSWDDDEEEYDLDSEDNDIEESTSEELGEVYSSGEEVAEEACISNIKLPEPEMTKKAEETITVAPNGKLYYIIVASCPDQKDAQRAINNLHKLGYDGIGILERDDRCRLYINRFGDRTEAEAYLKTLRQDSNFSSAWLLPVREASLSSIIKNTYDDNQLFMELSHLNQRTERDQG